jgi:hypothetical protein
MNNNQNLQTQSPSNPVRLNAGGYRGIGRGRNVQPYAGFDVQSVARRLEVGIRHLLQIPEPAHGDVRLE